MTKRRRVEATDEEMRIIEETVGIELTRELIKDHNEIYAQLAEEEEKRQEEAKREMDATWRDD